MYAEAYLSVAESARVPGSARSELRLATAGDHAAVDTVYSKFDLSRPEGYRAFLQAQYECLAPLEQAVTAAGVADVLPDWADRRRTPLLADDLQALGAAARGPARPHAFSTSGPAAMLGAVYVLEGSRFGGAMLARRLAPGTPARFLGAAATPAAWRGLVAALDRHLDDEARMDAAVRSARIVFNAFAACGRAHWEAANG